MGEVIRELRKKLQLTQAELAQRSGVSRATINAIENNQEYDATVSTLRKLAAALGEEGKKIFLPLLSSD